jgi:hypothetical protein
MAAHIKVPGCSDRKGCMARNQDAILLVVPVETLRLTERRRMEGE